MTVKSWVWMFLVVGQMSFVANVHADVLSCGSQDISDFYVQAQRDDNNIHSNRLLVKLSVPCNGLDYAYMDESNPLFQGFLSVVLAGFSASQKIHVYVNTSTTSGSAHPLAIVRLRK